jgi:hypothetical protein
MTNQEELEASARAGAELLNVKDPGWWHPDGARAIDLDTLDINSTSLCVLGQRYGDYGRGMLTIGLECVNADSEPRGFTPPLGVDPDTDEVNSARLTQAWKELIIARRTTGDETP